MITDNHRKLADLATHVLHLGPHRRAKLLNALAKFYPMITLAVQNKTLDIKKLRAARKQRKWSQTRLAKKIDLSLRQYQNIEKGHTGTTRARMVRIAQELGVSILEIT